MIRLAAVRRTRDDGNVASRDGCAGAHAFPMDVRGVVLVLLFALLSACGGYGVTGRQVVIAPALADSVVLTYLGSGGWLLESGRSRAVDGSLVFEPGPD